MKEMHVFEFNDNKSCTWGYFNLFRPAILPYFLRSSVLNGF